ncbi:MAG TPA: hypothetical protein VMF64_04600 [Steroidobacteraceae bacterium]|nr:hypothetical protein [Steroidobacteraceae bacterium]
MSVEREPDSGLERQVHTLLRSLPARHAPEHLMARVLEQIEQRAALPWWRRQVMHWPLIARLSFALLAVACLMLLSLAGRAGLPRLASPTAPMLAWGHHVLALLGVVPRLVTALLGALPMVWLQAILVIGLLAYLFLFGVGAAAYRLLYLEH